MSAPAKERTEIRVHGRVVHTLEHIWQTERLRRWRKATSLILFTLASALWLLGLGRMQASHETLPWYLTITTIAAASVSFLKVEKPVAKLVGLPRNKEPLLLEESLAICFLISATALYAWIAYSLLHPHKTRAPIRQIVDIQLLSERDYQNNREELPGTKTETELRKRTADRLSQKGSLNQPKVNSQVEHRAEPSVNQKETQKTEDREVSGSKDQNKLTQNSPHTSINKVKNSKPENKSKAEPTDTPALPIAATPLMVPPGWQTKSIDSSLLPAAKKTSNSKANQNQPYICEVEPPELVELVENDGLLDALHVFQKGGKTSGGKGAENGLSSYLKELNRRIKNAWSPPRGTTRFVAVFFRLKRNGHLAFLRVEESSGEKASDDSAIKAIIEACKKGAALPEDYRPDYLDVRYTFKYNVNELQELNDREE